MSRVNHYGVLEQHSVNGDIILQAAEEITNLGYAVIDSGYTVSQIEEIATCFDIAYSEYLKKYGQSFLKAIDEINGFRLPLAFNNIFLDLALNEIIISLIRCLIKGKFYLNQQNGIINPPGKRYNQDLFHRDLPYQHVITSRPLAIKALYCVDDFTELNGSTVVVPSSHKSEKFPSDTFIENHSITVEASAGSFIVLDCMLFHRGSFNTTSKPRRAINHVYTIPYFQQQINIPSALGLSYEMNDYQKEMLGYRNQAVPSIDDYLESRKLKSKRL